MNIMNKLGVVHGASLLLLLQCSLATAATLYVQETRITTKETEVEIPVGLSELEGDEVTAMQFDVCFNPENIQIQTVLKGDAASLTDKEIAFQQRSDGRIRIVIAGMNASPIQNGVLARLRCTPAATTALQYTITLEDAMLTNGAGHLVACVLTEGYLIIEEAEGEEEGEEEGDKFLSALGCAAGNTPRAKGLWGDASVFLALALFFVRQHRRSRRLF